MEVISNMREHDRKLEKAIEKSLRIVGGQAERVAKETITEMGAVDTGLLRNSITFAVAGDPANIGQYSNDAGTEFGEYEGNTEKDTGTGEHSVYVGTNVEYAPYVEYGTVKMGARPFLSQSIMSNQRELEKLFEDAMGNFMT